MRNTIKSLIVSCAAITAIAMSGSIFAQSSSGQIYVNRMSTGWGTDSFGISTSGNTAVNPAGCSNTDLYSIDGTDPGYKTFYAAALTAYTNGTPVEVIISNQNCRQGRPMILGISLLK
ncbi:hypothetical protein [Dyella tabacisoli]|uniref:Uncharacterized protein n=1 Tax=Dyella tabacisoli TaxID=2282381 RepID=A0A369UT57_9GAMM|nr:hypothetical protein [Dyella tabacisoli]RDD83235.1 hypothetical protein DVJ77_01120 [Dyella tabacisoli]